MELPPLTDIEGAYWYLISIIVGLAIVSGLYVVGVMIGLLPEPTRLIFPELTRVPWPQSARVPGP